MSGFFKAVFSRTSGVLLICALACAVLWFSGPLFAFGNLRPLDSVGARVTAIVLLLLLAMTVALKGPLGIPLAMAAALLIWHAGPMLSVADVRPLQPVWARAGVIGFLLLLCAVWAVYRLLRAIQLDRDLLGRILRRSSGALAPEVAERIDGMQRLAFDAVARLAKMRAGAGWVHRLLEGRRYLYELPWYVVIGGVGTGKTTALINSGLQFPITSRRVGAEASDGQGDDCGWHFTNEAVWVDSTGRFAADAYAAHWHGFLKVLRRARPRAPVNGVLIAVDAGLLLRGDPAELRGHAAGLRRQLEELRAELGIRCPAYLVVTKCDVLQGFVEYFGSLTSDGRAQVWGVTLPLDKQRKQARWPRWRRSDDAVSPEADDIATFGAQISGGLRALWMRLADGVASRLQEEFELTRRQALYALPHEFEQIASPLSLLTEAAFADSRFDATTRVRALRGVYFTSAAQIERPAARFAEAWATLALSARAGNAGYPDRADLSDHTDRADHPVGHRSYFLSDLLSRVVAAESHLVRPNLQWEARFRIANGLGHALVLVVSTWLGAGLFFSHRNNTHYLNAVASKAEALRAEAVAYYGQAQKAGAAFDTPNRRDGFDSARLLEAAEALQRHDGVEPADAPPAWRYGLHVGTEVARESADVYASLQRSLLLPSIVSRLREQLAGAVADGDETATYDALRRYLMLHDTARFDAAALRAWVGADWRVADGIATNFAGRSALLAHLQALFADGRTVTSAEVADEALVKAARAVLSGRTTSARLYERAKSTLTADAPADFTLLSAVGPQAGTVFSRASHQPLENGVPGLFTRDGYERVFSVRLAALIETASRDDAWVMGRLTRGAVGVVDVAAMGEPRDALQREMRRLYLQEYAQQWTDFLGDIRALDGANLAFDLTVLRQLAAPDSPLARLARAAAHETTLSAAVGHSADVRMERALVDDRFAALREVVTGQVDAQASAGASVSANGGAPASSVVAAMEIVSARPASLAGITGLINDFYTVLVVADTALAGGSIPPGAADAGVRLRLEASRMPAPFQEIMQGLAASGSDKVMLRAQSVLREQAHAQLDRLKGLMALQVTEPCRRAIEGRYPFTPRGAAAADAPDASVDDVQLLFATGGAFDSYLNNALLPYVDMSVRPWRYKSSATANMLVPARSPTGGITGGTAGSADLSASSPASAPVAAVAGPTLTGEMLKLLAESGPALEPFARAAQIREVFFREAGGRRLGWKIDLRVAELEPSITELVIDIDGQGQRYAHGPVQPWPVSWPGARGGASAEVAALPRVRTDTSAISAQGPWALLRLMEKGRIVSTATPGRAEVEFKLDGRRVVIDIATAGNLPSPLTSDLLSRFVCPGSIA